MTIGNSEQTSTEAAFALLQPRASAQPQKELVFIDAGAPNYQQLVQDLMKAQAEGRPIEVVVLESGRDGIEQITEAMAERGDVNAVHIVSHGSDGSLMLGNTKLSAYNLEKYRDAIASWQGSLAEGADLLIYGCDFAGSAQGREMVETLSSLTGADVAASTDTTGNTQLGGDWDLEYEAGEIEAQIAFSTELLQEWRGTLPNVTFDVSSTASISEELTETATFTVTLGGDPLLGGDTASVDIIATGSATSDTDYQKFVDAIETAAGATTGVVFGGNTLTFDSTFVGLSGETLVNTTTLNGQKDPAMAMNGCATKRRAAFCERCP